LQDTYYSHELFILIVFPSARRVRLIFFTEEKYFLLLLIIRNEINYTPVWSEKTVYLTGMLAHIMEAEPIILWMISDSSCAECSLPLQD